MSLKEKDNNSSLVRRTNHLFNFCVILLIVFFLVSCGIPNPLPELDNISITSIEFNSTTDGDKVEFDYDDGIDDDILDVADTTFGFNIYYEYTDSEDETSDASRTNTYKSEIAINNETVWKEETPRLEISVPEQELHAEISYVTTSHFEFRLYDDSNIAILVNGEEMNGIYDVDGDSLFLSVNDNERYLHLYIEFFIRNASYSPSSNYSDLEHIGFIDTNNL